MHWQVWVLCSFGIVYRLCASRCCSGSTGAAVAAAVTQLWKPGKEKGECWAQVPYRSCQNATIHLTQGLLFPCYKAVFTPSVVRPSLTFRQEAACHPRAYGWDAGVGSSVCFSRKAELFFSVTLLLDLSLLWR